MPNYDYVCQKCGHEFEVFQPMSADRLTDCPKEACDGVVKRKIGAGAGFVFKGSGFYTTDYRSASYKAGESAAKSSSSEAKSKSDSKPKQKSKE